MNKKLHTEWSQLETPKDEKVFFKTLCIDMPRLNLIPDLPSYWNFKFHFFKVA